MALRNSNRNVTSNSEQVGPHGLTKDAFVLKFIDNAKLRTITSGKNKGTIMKGLHTTFSGFNAAFELEFGEPPVIKTGQADNGRGKMVNVYGGHVTDMVKRNVIVSVPSFRGAMLYRPENAPQGREDAEAKGEAALSAVFGD